MSEVEEVVLSPGRGEEEGGELAVDLHSHLHQLLPHLPHPGCLGDSGEVGRDDCGEDGLQV